jgi:DNA polymerase III subunit epsilon
VAYLEAGPAASGQLVREVLGLARTPRGAVERLATTLLGGDPRVTRTDDGRWALAASAAASPALDGCRFAVVDLEATGTSTRRGARIIEVAVVAVGGGDPGLVYHTLVNPEQSIPPVVARLTGITDALVRDAPPFERVVDDVLGALAGAVFVAHNVWFDWSFLAAELRRTRALLLAGPRLCTVRLARRLLPPLESRNLDALAHYFGFEIAGRHRAGPDALAAARILERLLGIARGRGARTLGDLMATRKAERGTRNDARSESSAFPLPRSAFP